MRQSLVIGPASFRISQYVVGFDDLLEKTQALRPYAVRVILLHQLPEGLADPAGALGA
jgi:hypothetical protein